jgi:hypothetical protein
VRHRRSAQAGLVPTRAMCSWYSVRAATDLLAGQVDSELKASVIKVAEASLAPSLALMEKLTSLNLGFNAIGAAGAKVRGAKELSEVRPEVANP